MGGGIGGVGTTVIIFVKVLITFFAASSGAQSLVVDYCVQL